MAPRGSARASATLGATPLLHGEVRGPALGEVGLGRLGSGLRSPSYAKILGLRGGSRGGGAGAEPPEGEAVHFAAAGGGDAVHFAEPSGEGRAVPTPPGGRSRAGEGGRAGGPRPTGRRRRRLTPNARAPRCRLQAFSGSPLGRGVEGRGPGRETGAAGRRTEGGGWDVERRARVPAPAGLPCGARPGTRGDSARGGRRLWGRRWRSATGERGRARPSEQGQGAFRPKGSDLRGPADPPLVVPVAPAVAARRAPGAARRGVRRARRVRRLRAPASRPPLQVGAGPLTLGLRPARARPPPSPRRPRPARRGGGP